MILLIDNYDSFTYNLYQAIGQLYEDITVIRNDKLTIEQIQDMQPEAIIISPGPGYPKDAGISVAAIEKFSGTIPILGVCLGHQSIAQAFGGDVIHAKQLMHGKASTITVNNQCPVFKHLSDDITVARYHSLIVDENTLPSCLEITARDDTKQIMAIAHTSHPTYGVQFHPESILTKDGMQIIENFLYYVAKVKITPLHTEKNLFCYVPFAAADESKKVKTGVENQKSYILSVGKSNRDYDFLTEALQNTQYEVRILSDTWTEKEKHQNIRVYADVFGEKYLQMLAECWCVIVPLADIHISAGQFVFLQSMMFGKPVIVTESDTVHEYIENEKNGLIIPKEKQALLKALKRLEEDPALYQKLGKNGKIVYREKFSLQHMAEVIGKICCEDSKGGCK